MDYLTARANLTKLLCLNLDNYNFTELKAKVHKRFLKWHPDKNVNDPEKYRSQFECLKEAWDVFKKQGKDSGSFSSSFTPDDLFCDESMPSSSDDEYNNTPFDDEFFDASPKKNFSIPEYFRQFFRSKTNRRAGKLFTIFFLKANEPKVKSFLKCNDHCDYFGVWDARTNKEIIVVIALYINECRLVDVKKNLKKSGIFGAETMYAVKFNQLMDCVVENLGEPTQEPYKKARNKDPKPKEEKVPFNHRQLVDFCISHEIKEVYECMYEYAHLAGPCDREYQTKEHEEDHIDQLINAKIYVHMSDRRKVAKNAIDAVMAMLYEQLKSKSNLEFMNDRCRILGNAIYEIDDPSVFGLADFYSRYCIPKLLFKHIAKTILTNFMVGEPKQRWTGLIGPYGCGKSTFAGAFMRLFEGTTININCEKSRLAFYLGSAIGRRFVLMDDVKGRLCRPPPILTPGNGFDNLDDLRDHLDGHIPVQLEKKNQNPVSQIFPPGLITCNRYEIPAALRERIYFFVFKTNKNLFRKHPVKVTLETIFIALVLHDLLPVESNVRARIIQEKDRWWRQHNLIDECNCLKVRIFTFDGRCDFGNCRRHCRCGCVYLRVSCSCRNCCFNCR